MAAEIDQKVIDTVEAAAVTAREISKRLGAKPGTITTQCVLLACLAVSLQGVQDELDRLQETMITLDQRP